MIKLNINKTKKISKFAQSHILIENMNLENYTNLYLKDNNFNFLSFNEQ